MSSKNSADLIVHNGRITTLAPKHSVPEADCRFYARACAKPGGMRAGFEYFRNFERDAKDFAKLSKTPLPMPMLVLTGEKASGEFLIQQARLVATNVEGVVVTNSGHWLMEEAPEVARTRGQECTRYKVMLLGATMVVPPPGSDSREFGILRTFADEKERDDFYASPIFKAWEAKCQPLTETDSWTARPLHGLEAWFRSPHSPPPRWKMAVATFIGVFPVATILNLTLGRAIRPWNFLVSNAVFGDAAHHARAARLAFQGTPMKNHSRQSDSADSLLRETAGDFGNRFFVENPNSTAAALGNQPDSAEGPPQFVGRGVVKSASARRAEFFQRELVGIQKAHSSEQALETSVTGECGFSRAVRTADDPQGCSFHEAGGSGAGWGRLQRICFCLRERRDEFRGELQRVGVNRLLPVRQKMHELQRLALHCRRQLLGLLENLFRHAHAARLTLHQLLHNL